MNQVFSPSIFNQFLKEERKKRNLTISQLSETLNQSTGYISKLENSDFIVGNPKIEPLLQVYQLPNDYLTILDEKIDQYADNFLDDITFISNDRSLSYQKIVDFMHDYKNTILYKIVDVSHFISNTQNQIIVTEKEIELLTENISIFSDKIQSVIHIYIASYYTLILDYLSAQIYYNKSLNNTIVCNKYASLLYYHLALFYRNTHDSLKSLHYSDLATKGFAQTKNYKRLANLKTITGLQYFDMRYFSKALEVNLENLEEIQNLDIQFEKRSLLNNIAFIYFLQGNYEKAIEYYAQIDEAEMNEQHFYSYMLPLFITQDYIKTQEICEKGLAIAHLQYYQRLLNYFRQYFDDRNLSLLLKHLTNFYQRCDHHIDSFTKEELLCLIIELLKQDKQYKKALYYTEEKYHLSYK